MTLAELISQARGDLDDLIPPYLWSDADLLSCINPSIDTICQAAYLIYDDYSDFTIIKVTPGTAYYAKDSRIIRVREVRMDLQSYPLTARTREWLFHHYPTWTSAVAGDPKIYCENIRTGYIRLIPTPLVSDTMRLVVYRMPLTSMSLSDLTASPEFELKYHKYLKHGILARAYLKQDNEAYDIQKAEYHRQQFEGSDDGKIEGDVKKVFNLTQLAIQTAETVGVNKAFC
jgi:hypothetical protein